MNTKLATFLEELITYDYILFGSAFVFFILFFIWGLVARKNPAKSILLILISFIVPILLSTIGYVKMHEYLYSNSISIVSQKKLTFTKAVVIYGKIKNISKVDFKNCRVTANAYKVTGNALKDYVFKFKPFKKMSILEYDILKEEDREFKIIIEPFTYERDYNISVGATCR